MSLTKKIAKQAVRSYVREKVKEKGKKTVDVKPKKFKRIKIATTDYLSFFLLIVSIVLVATGPGVFFIWPIIFFYLFRRGSKIKTILEKGESTTATITKRYFFRHGCTFNFSYTVGGKEYKRRTTVRKYRTTLQVGDKVEIKYDSKKPKQAFIPSLYR